MSSITELVRNYLNLHPYLQEALRKGIINYAALAAQLKEYLEQDNSQKLKLTSVIMAIRRYQEKLCDSPFEEVHYGENAEANLKTNLVMFTLEKSDSFIKSLPRILSLVDFKSGGILHLVQGNYQATIITNSYYSLKIHKLFAKEKIIREDKNLVSIALKYADTLIDVPGQLFLLTRALAWENITIIDLIETMSETIVILREEDASRAFQTLSNLIKTYA